MASHSSSSVVGQSPVTSLACVVWLIGCSFFLMDYFVRISPSVMAADLMRSFHSGAFILGSLSAVYFVPYVLLQPFVGALVDRFGPRRLMMVGCAVATAGLVVFALAHQLVLLYLARFILGVCCAFSFIGTLKLITRWFDARFFAFFAGLTQAFGMLGAVVGDVPIVRLNTLLGWRVVMGIGAAVFLLLALLMFFLVRDGPGDRKVLDQSTQSSMGVSAILLNIRQVACRGQMWFNCLYNGLLYAPVVAFAGLWGIPFLEKVEHINAVYAAHQVSWVFLGVAAGSPLLGMWSNRIRKRLPVMRWCAFFACLLMCSLVYLDQVLHGTQHPKVLASGLLFLLGCVSGGVIPSYSLAVDQTVSSQQGIALGFTNMISLGIGAIWMPLVGWLLDRFWQGDVVAQHHVFGLLAYHHAFLVLPASLLLAFMLTFLLKEAGG